MIPIVLMMKSRIKRRIKQQGATYETRLYRQTRSSMNSIAIIGRPIIRERAKAAMTDFLQLYWDKTVLLAKF